MTYLLKHIYKDYLDSDKDFIADDLFKSICAEFNIAIIEIRCLNLQGCTE